MTAQKNKSRKRTVHTRSDLKVRAQRRRMHTFFFVIAGIALIGITVYLFLFSRSLFVQEVAVEGEGALSESVGQYIEKHLSVNSGDTNYTYPFDFSVLDRHMVFLNKGEIIASVVREFPTVQDIQVDRKFPHTLEIHVEKHDTLIVACGDGIRTRSACALIEENGIVHGRFDPDSVLAKENDALYITFSGDPLSKNERVFPEGVISNVRVFIKELPFETGLQMAGDIEIIARGESSLKIPTDSNMDLIIDGSRDPRLSMSVLQEFLAKIRSGKSGVKVKEIDLRIKDRVFYKEH